MKTSLIPHLILSPSVKSSCPHFWLQVSYLFHCYSWVIDNLCNPVHLLSNWKGGAKTEENHSSSILQLWSEKEWDTGQRSCKVFSMLNHKSKNQTRNVPYSSHTELHKYSLKGTIRSECQKYYSTLMTSKWKVSCPWISKWASELCLRKLLPERVWLSWKSDKDLL